jgi:4'-phosphopantetheinyl transferase
LITQSTKVRLLPIDSNHAHLWCINTEEVIDLNILPHLLNILSDEEKLQQGRFYFEQDRLNYIVAHSFLRLCLSRYAGIAPAEWIFEKDKYGKPHTQNHINGFPVKFNISHTQGYVACIIAVQHEVGVDVEYVSWDESKMDIAKRYFHDDEFHDLNKLSCNELPKRFFKYWTLKESFIKAKGVGLSYDLNKFYFQFNDAQPVRIFFCDDLNDNPDEWNIYLFEVSPHHICAVAIDNGVVPVTLIKKDIEADMLRQMIEVQ